jgi:hypothetical protein
MFTATPEIQTTVRGRQPGRLSLRTARDELLTRNPVALLRVAEVADRRSLRAAPDPVATGASPISTMRKGCQPSRGRRQHPG